DYSAAMLAPCRERYSWCKLLLCDGRNLCFPSETFDCVLMMWNALDDVNREGRARILAEIRRVLRPGGAFAFSSHNLDCYRKPAWVFGGFTNEGGWNEFARENVRRGVKYFTDIAHHLRMKKHELHTPDYSILNDPAFGYRLLTHYSTREQQARQLESA